MPVSLGKNYVERVFPHCPIHRDEDEQPIPAPCMFCLVPEVYELVIAYENNNEDVVYFTQSDENLN